MRKNSDQIIERLAKKYDLPVYVVKAVCYSPFSFLKSRIESGEFKSVMMPYLGKFIVPDKVYEKIVENNIGHLGSNKKQDEERKESTGGRET